MEKSRKTKAFPQGLSAPNAQDSPAFESWVDRQIRRAMEAGQFDDLPGAGRPIDWQDESLVDETWLMAFRLMREHGFAPQWVELHKEIRAELEKAGQTVARAWRWRQERLAEPAGANDEHYVDLQWARARAAFAETLTELNRKIADFNLQAPAVSLQKLKLDLENELARLGIDA